MPILPSISRFIDEFKSYPVSLFRRLSSSSFFRPPPPSSWMTYAETTRSAVVYSSIVPPPRTPVGPSMLKDGRKGSAPLPGSQGSAVSPLKNGSNSLDFWSKSEDEKSGITCYYSRHNIQFPSQRQINRMKAQPGRPTMNGLTTPSGSASPNGRFPPAPFPQGPPPAPESVMSPPVGIYRNVPAMPRAKLSDKQPSNGRSRQQDENQKNVVWGGSTVRRGDEDVVTPLHPPSNAINEKKRSTARRKPRWARCMQTLFCCVTPPREIEKIQSNQRTNSSTTIQNQHHQNGHSSATTTNGSGSPPIQLITQVNRDGTVTGLPPAVPSVQQNGSGDGQTAYEKIAVESVPVNEKPLLPPLLPQDAKKKCLVIDLDETLVHSSFKPVKNPDFVIPVEIDGVEHQVYVLKRPYVDEFLAKVGEHFECVLFTASLAKYADPVADLLDKKKVFRSRLFREACVFHKGNYVKDLSRLGRDLNQTLIIDNSPASYAFHPENAVPVTTWFDDPADTELMDILPTLKHLDGYASIYELYRPDDGPQSELLNHCSC